MHLYPPARINVGPWLVNYTRDELERRAVNSKMVLPICSLGTLSERLAELAPLVLPPLYHEALNEELKDALLARIQTCFPYFEGTHERETFTGQFEIVELPPAPPAASPNADRIVAFSVDTAVEEHGPHLPLATDTIQSYAVLEKLAEEFGELLVGPPVEYGHLTWGLPFGFSIDITPELLTPYVKNYANAILRWLQPRALFVVDVHGSLVHRNAIQDGLHQSECDLWRFCWLHDPLVPFAGDRGDQHAGGVETALVEHVSSQLVDSSWWPGRIDDLEASQMSLETAVSLSSDLNHFITHVAEHGENGIVGNIRNYLDLDARLLMESMLAEARTDVVALLDHRE